MKVNCLTCGHSIDLDDAYGDYQGEVRCFVCGSLLEVRIESDRIKSVRLPTPHQRIRREETP